MSIPDRVTKLIALAGSSNLNEARTAAYQACKLIREHKLVVTEAGAPKHVSMFPDEGWNAPDSSWVPEVDPKKRKGRAGSVVFVARNLYVNRCKLCGEPILVGEPMFWKGGGVGEECASHRDCGSGI